MTSFGEMKYDPSGDPTKLQEAQTQIDGYRDACACEAAGYGTGGWPTGPYEIEIVPGTSVITWKDPAMDGLYLYKVKTDKPYRDGVDMILSLLAAGAVANVGERARDPVPSIGFVTKMTTTDPMCSAAPGWTLVASGVAG